MEYAQFAGIIPKGEYGAGTVSIWDSGEFECEKWRDGKEVIATLTGKPGGGLHGTRRFALIHTGESPSQWLIHLMKDKPGHRTVLLPDSRPQPIGTPSYAPMLATSGTTADVSSGDWLFELKWDGFRAIVSGSGGKIRLTSRSGIDMTPTYPELADPRYWPDHDFVADGEIVALSKNGRPSFELLQKRMNLFKPGDVERARAAVPVQLMVFDLLYDAGSQGGADLTSLPLSERREKLAEFRAKLPAQGSPIHVSEILEHDLDDILATAGELGLEGVMAKRADSRYQPGGAAGPGSSSSWNARRKWWWVAGGPAPGRGWDHWRVAGGDSRRRQAALRGPGGHRVQGLATARHPEAPARSRSPGLSVPRHPGRGRRHGALGFARARGRGDVRRLDRRRENAPSRLARLAPRQVSRRRRARITQARTLTPPARNSAQLTGSRCRYEGSERH